MITFSRTDEDTGNVTETVSINDHSSLSDILEAVKRFVLACGYVVDPLAELEFVEEDEAIFPKRTREILDELATEPGDETLLDE